ncbi:flippase [Bifidobacterium sp. 82T10]|uniref:Flippase n=1 Tax=Bifidobacterium miconis TaxID=2834435 RepID=A0ABS6WJI0_9BIFI|nr:flippase [Bifidobacterium miconis]MBW3093427.1 flippase [Bifidobacterium miconis]
MRIHSLKYNAFMNMILMSSSFIFPLITVPYVSRILSPSGMGAVAFAQSVVSYFSLFSLLGISTYGVRACAQVRDNKVELSKTVEELLVILVISTFVVYCIYLAVLNFIPRFSSEKKLFLFFGSMLWLTSIGVEWFYQAIEQYDYITIRSILFKIIGLFLMFMFVKETADYRIYGLIVVFGSCGANILNLLRLHSFVSFIPFSQLNLKRHLKPMKSFLVSSISSGMYTQIDLVLLGFLSSNGVVGIYQLVVKIKSMLLTAINSVVNVMLPRLSYYAKNSQDKYRSLFIKNINFVFLFSFSGIFYVLLCADAIIDILGGSQYTSAVMPLICILPALLIVSLNTILSQYLISSGREKEYAFVNFIGLVFSIVFCLLLIPPFGAVGAAFSCSLCELCALIVRCWFARAFIKGIVKDIKILPAPCAACVSFFIVFSIRQLWWPANSFMKIIVSGVLFLIPYFCFLVIFREETVLGILSKFCHLHEKNSF